MKVYGNLHNRIMESSRQPAPEIGMGATIIMYSDRHAGTVVLATPVKGREFVTVQADKAIRTDDFGMSDTQSYRYERDPHGRGWNFRKDKTGRWTEVVRNLKTKRWNQVEGGAGLLLGERDTYHDYGF